MTNPARTAFDIGRRLSRDAALPILDALCAATGLHAQDIAAVARSHSGTRGMRRLADLIPLVDAGAESPPESRTRLLLVDHGLPAPATQLVVRDSYGVFVARLDMGWEQWRVAVEYDGAQHWTDPRQRAKDIDRLAVLESLSWRIVRVGATLLHRRPHIILDRVHAAIRAQGIGDDHCSGDGERGGIAG
ncbi:endonuclease domain-containing protein [Nocardia uniformis]|uniref:endonuclease domain-containing protein n=1 Tax=Nocardia uniformis TaxID=53432 RepID=UPI001FE03C25|nr:DUF559 domain-containing protein [Nocardia uniformis]